MLLSNILKFITFLVLLGFAGCKKQTVIDNNFATLQIYGWTTDPSVVVVSLKETPLLKYREALPVTPYQTTIPKVFITEPRQPVSFFAFPDTLPGSKPVMKLQLELEKKKIYSLYVGGEPPSLDTVLIEENFPEITKADGKTGFRFLNLMKGDPVSINFAGEPHGSIAANVPYMGVTEFKMYPITEGMTPFIVEVRDAVTQELLVSREFIDMQEYSAIYDNWLGKLKTHSIFGIRGETQSPVNKMRISGITHDQ